MKSDDAPGSFQIMDKRFGIRTSSYGATGGIRRTFAGISPFLTPGSFGRRIASSIGVTR